MKSGLLAAVAIALAPIAAHAQPSCKEVNTIIAEAPHGFRALRGDELEEDYFESTAWLKYADECGVDVSFVDLFVCTWNFDPAMARNNYDAFAKHLPSCLPGWDQKDAAGKDSLKGTTIETGVSFGEGPDNQANTVVILYIEPDKASNSSTLFFQVVRY